MVLRSIKYISVFSVFFLLLLGLYSCKNENTPEPKDTPEEVIKLYQSYIDKNEFGKAKSVSTLPEQERLDDLQAIIGEEFKDQTVLNTIFLKINCQIVSNTAFCLCELKDDYEEYEAAYRLLLVNNQWLVDAPEEDIDLEEDMLEKVLDNI